MDYRVTTGSVEKPYLKVALVALLGIVSVILAVSLADYALRSALVVSVLLVVIVFATYFASYQTLTRVSLIFLGLGIPFNLDINLFYRPYVGVTSVDIGITLLCAIALYILFFYDHMTKQTQVLFRYNRTLFWAPILYMLAGFLSFYNASSPELVVLELIRLAMLFVIFFIIMNLRDRREITTFVFVLSIGVVLQACIAYYQYKTGRSLGLGAFGERALVTTQTVGFIVSRATGTIGHPNILAYYFEMLVPLMFAMFLAEERGWLRFWYLLALMCGLGGLVTTLSRGGWLTVPVSLTLVFIAAYRPKFTRVKMHGFLAFGLICGVLFLSLVYPTVERRLNFTDFGSAKSRVPLNVAAISVIKQFPITGVGLNNLARVFRTYDTTGGSALVAGGIHVVHNLFLCVWVETGTIGIAAFLWMFVAAFGVALKYLFRASNPERAILIGAAAGVLAQMIHGLFDPGFRILMNTSMLFYSLLGLIGAVAVHYRDAGEKTAP
jgi:O-antigen ligase